MSSTTGDRSPRHPAFKCPQARARIGWEPISGFMGVAFNDKGQPMPCPLIVLRKKLASVVV